MKIENINPYSYSINKNLNFGAASDITIEYVLKKHSKFLPETMLGKIKELVSNGETKKPLYELHNEVYKDLFEAKTLEDVTKYAEFSNVKDVTSISDNRSKAIKSINKFMPLEKFTVFYLKKLYQPTSQDNLVEMLGFTNRNLLAWLNKKLNIKKLNGSYIKLIQMSNEEENSRIAELSRKAIYADKEVQKYRLQKAAEAHRTPEYRAKKKQEMKDYYLRHPETAEKTGLISKMTWDRCPEIKKAFSIYTKSLSSFTRKILSKKLAGETLTPEERRIAYGYYRGFWEKHPDFKAIYKERRLEVIEELNSK